MPDKPPLVHTKVLFPTVDCGLLIEWNARWRAAQGVDDAKQAFPVAGSFSFGAHVRDWVKFTRFERFLISDVYLGSLHLPRDDFFDTSCPICGDELSRQHIMLDCRGLQLEREILYHHILAEKLTDLRWIARFGEHPVCEFLSRVQQRFIDVGNMDIRSNEIRTISSIG